MYVKLSFDVEEDRLVDVIIGGSDDISEDGCFGTSILLFAIVLFDNFVCIRAEFKFVLKLLRLQQLDDMNDRLLLLMMHLVLLYCCKEDFVVAIVERFRPDMDFLT